MNVRHSLNKLKLHARKAGPGLMVAGSIALGIASIFEFCKQSREGIPIVDDYKETVDELRDARDVTGDTKTFRKDLITETAKTGVALAKVYAKPIALFGLSVGLNVKSYKLQKDRNLALAAAYAGLGGEIRNVYSSIEEKYGADAVDEIKYGIKKQEIEETHIDPATGSEVTETKIISVVDGDENKYSPYARFFNDTCLGWTEDADTNRFILTEIEADCNRILRTEGRLFLNQVYDKLGMKKSRAGQEVGWKYYPKGNHPCGDNKVSFGIYRYRIANQDFVNGYEPVILLDFNVDGRVVDDLDEY